MANIFLSQSQHKQILRFMFMQLNNYGFIIKWQLLQSDRRKTVFTAWSQLCKIFCCWICEFQVFFICRSIGFSFSPRLLFVYFSFFLFCVAPINICGAHSLSRIQQIFHQRNFHTLNNSHEFECTRRCCTIPI